MGVNDEEGGETGVARDAMGTRVGGVAVVPVGEVVVRGCTSSGDHQGIQVKAAAACGIAKGIVVAINRYRIGVRCEMSRYGAVSREVERVGIGGAAIAPVREVVAKLGSCADDAGGITRDGGGDASLSLRLIVHSDIDCECWHGGCNQSGPIKHPPCAIVV